MLAWSLGSVAEALGAGAYVIAYAEGIVSPLLLPIIIFFITGFVSFAIDTSWGMMSIMMPIVVPLAWGVSGSSSQFIPVGVGAMFSGAIFGNNCSSISDTTILAATFTGSDHIDHVRTQIYHAETVFLVATAVFLLYGFTMITPLVLLPAGLGVLYGLVYLFSEWDAQRKGLLVKPGAIQSSKREPANDD